MTLLNVIHHSGRKIFLHFHDAWKEEEHPRGGHPENPGQFSKGSGGGAHPTAAKGAVVVDPVAKVLKSHGYVKKKGSNVFQHPTGHEVEVHAASEGQKWLTGWTHGTSGQTGSGAGKLNKHLQSLPHGLPSQEQKKGPAGEPPTKLYEYGENAKHSSPTIHNEMTSMGFTPKIKTVGEGGTTTYEHPTKGEVVIDNESGGKVNWKYYKDPNATEPTATGSGVVQNLGNMINSYFPSTSSYTPPPVAPPVYEPPSVYQPTVTAKPHPNSTIDYTLQDMGFKPVSQNASTTTYEHPTKGKVVLSHDTPKSGYNKGKMLWKYTPPGGKVISGHGVKNGNLKDTVQIHGPSAEKPITPATPKPVEATKATVVKPSWAKYPLKEETQLVGEPADRYSGNPDYPEESLIVGKGVKNEGRWQLWNAHGSLAAAGKGQEELNEAFEKLHPRGAGGKFIAKPGGVDVPFVPQPGSKEETLANKSFYSPNLMAKGFKPYGEDQNNIWFEKGNFYIELSKKTGVNGDYTWTIVPPDEANIKGESLTNLMGKLHLIEATTAPPTNISTPSGVDEKDHNTLVSAGYEPIGKAPWGDGSVYMYAQKDGSIVLTKPMPNDMKASIFPLSPVVLQKQPETVEELKTMLGGKTPIIGTVPEATAQFSYSEVPVHGLMIPQHPGVKLAEPQAMPSGNVRVSINNASQTLVVRKDGTWQLYEGNFVTGIESTIAEGSKQSELNVAFINQYGYGTVSGPGGAAPNLPINPNNYTTNIASGKAVGAYTFPNTETIGGAKSFIEEDADQFTLTTGQKLVLSKKSNIWEITDPTGATLEFGAGQLELDHALSKHGITAPSPTTSGFTAPEILASALGVFKPLQTSGFELTTNAPTNSFSGWLNNDPNIKMAFSYDNNNKTGVVSWQINNDPVGAHTQNFSGPVGHFYNKVKEQYDEAQAASAPAAPKVQHFDKSSSVPAELNGVAFKSWIPPLDWSVVEGQNPHIQEPPMVSVPGKKQSAGLLIVEPDGRIWIVKPKNEYQGVKYTFPKGGQEVGDSLQATAIKETWEESGLKAEITGFAGDYLGTTSQTRYYFAKRTGGTPIDFGAESEQVSLIPKEDLGKYLNQARDLKIAKDHFAPKAVGHPIQLNDLTKVGEKKGSNPGGIYQDAEGKKFYVKHLKSNQHVANELLAADLLAKAGGGTLKYHPVHGDGGKTSVGTEWEALQKDNVSKLSLNEKRQAQSDFALNAWLANWDAAGTGGDNVGVLNGKTVTLDVGGALLYRAQGDPKGSAFGYDPTEWETLRNDPVKNPDAYKLYHEMTNEQLKESTEKLNNITNQDILDAVSSHFPGDSALAHEIADKLIARRTKLLAYGAALQVAPKAPAYTPTPSYAPPKPPTPTYTQQNPGPQGHADADGLRRKMAKWNPPSKPSTAISGYKGSSHYHEMNAMMRMGELEDDDHSLEAKYIREITKWLDKASTHEELVVYRGVPSDVVNQWNKFAKPGRVIVDAGFQSTSTSKQFADSWRGGSGITLKIHMPVGTKAATVRSENESDGEYEAILQNGTKLRIINWTHGNYEVAVEQPGLPKWKQGTT